MSIVSNASPLINPARIGKPDLLRQLYGELAIPEAVWHEVVVEGSEQPGAHKVETATWIETRAVADRKLVRALQQELDAGEAEGIVLALEMGPELLLMDEHLGRETARHLGVRCTGLIGVLSEAAYQCNQASFGYVARHSWLPRERCALRAGDAG